MPLMTETMCQALLVRTIYPLAFRHERLKTFIGNWDISYPVSPVELARNGFYYAGTEERPDGVKCFYCNAFLHNWETYDVVEYEHARLSPYCPVFGSIDVA